MIIDDCGAITEVVLTEEEKKKLAENLECLRKLIEEDKLKF